MKCLFGGEPTTAYCFVIEAAKEFSRIGYGGIRIKQCRQPVCSKAGVIELEIIGSNVGSQLGTIGERKEFSVVRPFVG
jgi:hypothetical protein